MLSPRPCPTHGADDPHPGRWPELCASAPYVSLDRRGELHHGLTRTRGTRLWGLAVCGARIDHERTIGIGIDDQHVHAHGRRAAFVGALFVSRFGQRREQLLRRGGLFVLAHDVGPPCTTISARIRPSALLAPLTMARSIPLAATTSAMSRYCNARSMQSIRGASVAATSAWKHRP